MDRQFRVARVWSNTELRKFSPHVFGRVINVSAANDEDKEGGHYADYFGKADSYVISNFALGSDRGYRERPGELLIDLEGQVPTGLQRHFNTVFNHTTLEHVFDVRTAFSNLCALTNDLLLLVVPCAQAQHDAQDFADYWRFMPTGMRRLFGENGLTVIYEAANNHRNAATYLFFAGSRQPERWVKHLGPVQPLQFAAGQIGRSNFLLEKIRWWINRKNQHCQKPSHELRASN